ncbi:MAG: hypothetical protein QOG69_444 [Actinomycetota bacterium]|jgi:hypothetical protein|nr:hypothetical protein [Actinomycetota bacterium]
MKSRHSQLAQVVGIAVIAVMATACGGAKAKVAAAGGTGNAVGAGNASDAGNATAADSAAAAAPVKATGGGSFCKLYAASVNSATQHTAAPAPEDTKARIEAASSDAHMALGLAPSEIKKDVALLVGVSDKMYAALAKAGYDYSKLTPADMAAFSTPQVAAAEEHLTAYIKGTCGIDLASGMPTAPTDTSGDAPAAGATDAAAAADGGKACQLATAAQISTAAGKPMQSVGGAGDIICTFSAVDDASFAMSVAIYNDEASMVTIKSVESGSEHLAGLADDAFWNPTIGAVFVQKGSRGFSFALPSFANLTDNPAAVKTNMVTLAREALTNF